MNKKAKRLTTLALVLIMALSLVPLTALADANTHKIENTYPTAQPIAVGQKIEVGGRQNGNWETSEDFDLYDVDMKYTFDVAQTSTVTVTLSTEATPYGVNMLELCLICADGYTTVWDMNDREESSTVKSDENPLTKDISFKVVPGTYFLRVFNMTAYNAFGWVQLKSVTPMQDDFGGEPNDDLTLAAGKASLQIGVEYKGNINYWGKKVGNDYGLDTVDWYRFDVPNDGYNLKITASRADTTRQNYLRFYLCKSDGYEVDGDNFINLEIFPSGSCEYNNLAKGTYFIKVDAWAATSRETEYTFKLESTSATVQPGANPSEWAVERVTITIEMGIVPDFLQSKYQTGITRAEFCALATLFYEMITGESITGRTTFTDTSDVYVEKMAFVGVVSGMGDGTFNPNGTFTREMAARLLVNLADKLGSPMAKQETTCADRGNISSWAYDAVGQVQLAQVMTGTGDNKFDPQVGYSREMSIITMLTVYNYLSR